MHGKCLVRWFVFARQRPVFVGWIVPLRSCLVLVSARAAGGIVPGSRMVPARPDMSTPRLVRSAVLGLALLLVSVVLVTCTAPAAAAAVTGVARGGVGSTPDAGSPVRAVAATAVDRAALTQAYLSARGLPARAVGGCGRGLPIAVRAALGVSLPANCYAGRSIAPHVDSRAIAAAARRSVGRSIADIALSQVGVAANPVVMNFTGLDCDPYTTLVGPPVPNSNGCGFDTRFGVQNENETWCSDFAKWVWQRAGVTTDMNTINAGARSFYAWGLEQREVVKPDSGTPAVGDAVVFYPPGRVSRASFADHVGIVSSVNRDGTVSLVNGDFIRKTNVDVEYDANVSLTRWASGVWKKGEQWVLVAPPTVVQHPAPSAAITGPGLAVAGTSVSFQAHAVEEGGSITQYLWTFGDGGTATGPEAIHVFTGAEPQTVTMTATSSFGTVTTRTLNLAVVAPSAATASTPSTTVWYSTTPVDQTVFLPTAAGALAAESWNGARWLHRVLPGRADPRSAPTALNYPDGSDVIQPRVFFRSADGHLA
jgi:hypothetical protein